MSKYEADIKEYYSDKMPEDIQILAARARYDLNFGPLYLSEGESCSPFDKGAVRFRFGEACTKISDWCDENMTPLFMETWCGYIEGNRPEGDEPYFEWDEAAQKKILFGELAEYL